MPRSPTVLVADDEESAILLLQTALEETGLAMELVIARDGQEAVAYLSALGPKDGAPARPHPSLLLLDLKMPRMDGFAVLTWLRTRPEFKDLPVILFSSSNHDADMEKARQLGAREYRVKPVGFTALIQLLRDIHARYLTPG